MVLCWSCVRDFATKGPPEYYSDRSTHSRFLLKRPRRCSLPGGVLLFRADSESRQGGAAHRFAARHRFCDNASARASQIVSGCPSPLRSTTSTVFSLSSIGEITRDQMRQANLCSHARLPQLPPPSRHAVSLRPEPKVYGTMLVSARSKRMTERTTRCAFVLITSRCVALLTIAQLR